MATIKERVHKHKHNGTGYDTVHYETEASLVIYGNTNVAAVLDSLASTYAASSHTHGNVTNAGAITATGVAIANGDSFTIVDSSASGKLVKSSITFDGSTATKALTQKGTWETFNNYTHPTTSGNKHIPSGGSSGQFLKWSSDGTAVWAADNNTTYSNFVKSGSTAAAGLVPSPGTTAGTTKYLREDASWQVPPNTTYSNFVKSGSTAAAGLVPSPGTTAGTTKYLREDATWAVPPDNNTTYSTFVKSGSTAAAGLVPKPSTTAGTTKYLREDATWAVPPDNNTTYSDFTAATSSAAGTHGLVPAPASGKQDSFLRGNKTWATANDIINTLPTGSSDSTAADYLVSQYAGGGTTTTTYHRRPVSKVVNATIVKAALGTGTGTTKYLREDGTWQVPYTHPTTAGNKHIPSGGSSGQFLGWDSAGTAKWVANPNTNTTYTFATGDANGQIKVTPSGGTATNISVKGLGSAAYTASTAYLDAGLGFYANSAVDTAYYVTTSITVATSANAWINGMIEGSRGNTTRPLMVRFMVYWNKSTLSAASFYDPMGGISEISAHLDASNKVYFSFKCATQYSQIRFFAYTGTTATGGTNSATAISATAPATFSVTKAMTKVYEVRTTTSVGSASGWSAGTAASTSVASGVLTITNGTKPSLTVTSTTVAT